MIALVAGFLLRVVLAARTPLFPDEAYYWEWSRHLAAGYFDHPPAVAWLIAGGTLLAGDTPLGIRIGALVAGTLLTLLLVALAHRLAGERAGRDAAVLLLCMPVAAVGLVVATTDAPALLAFAAALYAIVGALEAKDRRRATFWWIGAGCAFGLGLLSKFTVGIAGVTVGIALLTRASLRAELRRAGPWLAVGAAALVALPTLWWNAHHDWLAVRFQLHHGLGAPGHGTAPARELSLLAGQLGLASPLIFVLLVIAVGDAMRRGVEDRRHLLALSATLLFAFFVYGALRRPAEPNWPALALVGAVPLLASSPRLTRGSWWRVALGSGAALVLIAVAQVLAPILPIPARRDPVARAAGWDVVARRAGLALRDAGPHGDPWLASDRYQDAAELAFHSEGKPRVFALNFGGRGNQYDLWPSFPDRARRGDALVAELDTGTVGRAVAGRIAPYFARVEPGERVALERGSDTVAMRQLWIFHDWRGGWPRNANGRR
ncbi:MAG TPA: glycosyltransferase family 39 protein [Gemmatimonadaceae bacterium]